MHLLVRYLNNGKIFCFHPSPSNKIYWEYSGVVRTLVTDAKKAHDKKEYFCTAQSLCFVNTATVLCKKHKLHSSVGPCFSVADFLLITTIYAVSKLMTGL